MCICSGKLALLQEWTKRGKIMTSARLSTEALESCFRRVICKGMKEGKPPASTARWLFAFAKRGEVCYTMSNQTKKGLQSSRSDNPNTYS